MKGLTKREAEVADILLEGRSNKEIARRSGITEGT
jgi:DNA-binding CsgD family transcriptional regulator